MSKLGVLLSVQIVVAIAYSALLPPSLFADEARPVEVVEKADAWYSRDAQMGGMEGVVRLLIPVDSFGAPGEPQVISGCTPLLEWSAIWAAKNSKFRAAMDSVRPIDSEIELEYEFICERDSLGAPEVPQPELVPPRHHSFDVHDYQICLYGHWLSGKVEVLQLENRVYVGGIRVYPAFYDRAQYARLRGNSLLKNVEEECEILQRDLLLQGYSPTSIENEVCRLLWSFPSPVDYEVFDQGRIAIRADNAEFEVTIMTDLPPLDLDDYWTKVRLGKSEGVYWAWLMAIDKGNIQLFKNGVRSSLGRSSSMARAIEQHVQESQEAGVRPFGRATPATLDELGPGLSRMLKEPEWFFEK